MARHIVILTVGTRGDVQPLIPLARALEATGYRVTLAIPVNYLDWVRSYGLRAVKCGGDFEKFVTDQATIQFIRKGFFRRLREAKSFARTFFEELSADMVEATADADALLFHPKLDFACDIAEAKRIPAALTAFQPFTATGSFPILTIPAKSLGALLNRLSYRALYLGRLLLRKDYNRWRKDYLDLAPRSALSQPYTVAGDPVPALYAISSAVLPRPDDWPDNAHLTGYWFLDDETEWTPPQGLSDFIAAGPPPIYIGFGSMPDLTEGKGAQCLLEALAKSGLRAVLARGWGGLGPAFETSEEASSGNIHVIDSAPHSWLFPRVAGVAHHGGAGTTAAGLRAGRPTLVCPFIVDQPWWGRRVAALGAGPQPLAPKKWTVDTLAARLVDLANNAHYQTAAANIGDRIAAESGPARAAELITSYFGAP